MQSDGARIFRMHCHGSKATHAPQAFWFTKSYHESSLRSLEYACSPPTYVASTEAETSAANSPQESTDRTTKSASLPGDRDPISSSRKHDRAAEIVYLPDCDNQLLFSYSQDYSLNFSWLTDLL